jgi:hypothetical protein
MANLIRKLLLLVPNPTVLSRAPPVPVPFSSHPSPAASRHHDGHARPYLAAVPHAGRRFTAPLLLRATARPFNR